MTHDEAIKEAIYRWGPQGLAWERNGVCYVGRAQTLARPEREVRGQGETWEDAFASIPDPAAPA